MALVANRSAKFLLVEARLGQDLAAHLLANRPDVTYERIARDLWLATDVDLTAQTVANWVAEVEADHSPAEPTEKSA